MVYAHFKFGLIPSKIKMRQSIISPTFLTVNRPWMPI